MKALESPASEKLSEHRPFVYFWFTRVATIIGYQMLTVAIGWQVQALTGSAFDLGLIGLVQFLPAVVLLLAGHVAVLTSRIRYEHVMRSREPATLKSVFAGLAFIRSREAMRDRVSAVNAMFIGTSNQMGEFESGVTAAWLGTVPSVVIGGVGTIPAVMVGLRLFPGLARIDRLESVRDV